MKIESSYVISEYSSYKSSGSIDLDKALEDKLDAKSISTEYYIQYQEEIKSNSSKNFAYQSDVFTLADIGYSGKPIAELTQSEAKELVSDDGFFGVSQTSERIANFVLNGAGDNVEMLKAGREGMIRGFEEAETLWGEKLPDISYETMNKAIAMIDDKLNELGASILDSNA
jgi:hypothetical protein